MNNGEKAGGLLRRVQWEEKCEQRVSTEEESRLELGEHHWDRCSGSEGKKAFEVLVLLALESFSLHD